jgi:urease accessory protein UreE
MQRKPRASTNPSRVGTWRRPPKLPGPVEQKLYKTGQTRGASPAEIYQNRVVRNSTVLVPFRFWSDCQPPSGQPYEKGAIALIDAGVYFEDRGALANSGLTLGKDALVFYSQRADWVAHPPSALDWQPAISRIAPLGGTFVARIAATTSNGVDAIREGFTTSASRGAGIRVYEYAPKATVELARLQLEVLLWRCADANEVFERGDMTATQISQRAAWHQSQEEAAGVDLTDLARLRSIRALDDAGHTVCPLCLKRMSAQAFADKVQQAAGRERFDARNTETSLFHIAELRVGELGHRPYNLGWGHHHCNVVAKDDGVPKTLEWMREVIHRNDGLSS